jgi:uncharacterized protein (TIGR02646 family)
MEKIKRPLINEIPTLKKLEDNWEQWGKDYEKDIKKPKKKATFIWREGIYQELRKQLELLTFDASNLYSIPRGHCSFCDSHPIGTSSTQTIEHYLPKKEFPLKSYQWENLFFCCNQCQTNANSIKGFKYTLKPDDSDYSFDKYFWFDASTGKIEILEDKDDEIKISCNDFLIRYGINDKDGKRRYERSRLFRDILSALKDPENQTNRDDFAYRFVYDAALKHFNEFYRT